MPKRETIPFESKSLPDQERLAMAAVQRWLDRLPSARSRVRVIEYVGGLRKEALERASAEERAMEHARLLRLEASQKQASIPGTTDQ